MNFSFHYPAASISNMYIGLIFILNLFIILKLYCILFLLFFKFY